MWFMASLSWSSWWAELSASRRMSVSFISFSLSSVRSCITVSASPSRQSDILHTHTHTHTHAHAHAHAHTHTHTHTHAPHTHTSHSYSYHGMFLFLYISPPLIFVIVTEQIHHHRLKGTE